MLTETSLALLARDNTVNLSKVYECCRFESKYGAKIMKFMSAVDLLENRAKIIKFMSALDLLANRAKIIVSTVIRTK